MWHNATLLYLPQMMDTVLFDAPISDDERRAGLYAGKIYVSSATEARVSGGSANRAIQLAPPLVVSLLYKS